MGSPNPIRPTRATGVAPSHPDSATARGAAPASGAWDDAEDEPYGDPSRLKNSNPLESLGRAIVQPIADAASGEHFPKPDAGREPQAEPGPSARPNPLEALGRAISQPLRDAAAGESPLKPGHRGTPAKPGD